MTNPTTTAVGEKPYTAPAREIWAWGIGALAAHLLIQTYSQAYNIFTLGFGLSPVLVSWCMMLPRILDGITDPIIGHLSDNTHTRWGRRKPYLAIGAVFGALFLSAIWWANPAWNEKVQFAYLLALCILFYIAYGIYAMAWSAVGYELTDDYNERSKVQAVGSFFLALVSLSAGWMYWLALRNCFHDGIITTVNNLFSAGFDYSKLSATLAHAFQDTVKGSSSEVWGMRWIAAGVGVLIIFSALVAARGCRERFTHTNRKHPPIGAAIKEAFRNKPFVIIQMVYMFQTFAQRLGVVGFLVFIGTYYVCEGDKGLATKVIGWGTTIGTVLVFGLLPLMKPISKWIGKKGALLAGTSILMVVALLQPFTLRPGHPWLLLVPQLIFTLLTPFCFTLINAIVPDVCDLDELQSGRRREGLFAAVMGLLTKMAISLSTLLMGYLLLWFGLGAKSSGALSPEMLHRLNWVPVLLNIFFNLGALVCTLVFPMNEASAAEVRRQLDERRLAKAGAGEPTNEVSAEFVHEHPEVIELVEKDSLLEVFGQETQSKEDGIPSGKTSFQNPGKIQPIKKDSK
ncbi:MAG: MFS transporter [Chthoniobacteraceae bacterium]